MCTLRAGCQWGSEYPCLQYKTCISLGVGQCETNFNIQNDLGQLSKLIFNTIFGIIVF